MAFGSMDVDHFTGHDFNWQIRSCAEAKQYDMALEASLGRGAAAHPTDTGECR